MKKIFATLVSSSVLAASFTLLSAPANAANFKSCVGTGADTGTEYTLKDNVSGISDCKISKDALGNDSKEVVNQAKFFGNINWEFGEKLELGDGKGQNGTWDISSAIQDTWQDVMLIFKSGSDKGGSDKGGSGKGGSDKGGSDKGGSDKGGSDKGGSGTRLVGYKVDKDEVKQDGGIITWHSPFEPAAFEEYDFKGGDIKDVSHISLYYTKTSTPPKQEVPEPASLFGLGVVGGAMVLSRRRRLNR